MRIIKIYENRADLKRCDMILIRDGQMKKLFACLNICFLLLTIFPAVSRSGSSQERKIHTTDEKESDCSICHISREVLKQGASNICIECHKNSVTITENNTLTSHVLPMHNHSIKSPVPPGLHEYKIIKDDGHVYVEYRGVKLPLFGMSPETATMECSTCHDPHGSSENQKMLRINNSRGELCEVCHDMDKLTLTHADNSKQVLFDDVHVWPGSRCNICHLSSNPDAGSSFPVNIDQSRLCESCHKNMITILPTNVLYSKNINSKMNNHPIKFSPLDFSPQKINQNIVKEGAYFYVSGQTGKVPVFGETARTAVAECSTCHEPHGKIGMPKLPRIKNPNGELCLVCHIDMKI